MGHKPIQMLRSDARTAQDRAGGRGGRGLPGVLEDLVELLLDALGEHDVARLGPAHAEARDAVDGVTEQREHRKHRVHERVQQHQQQRRRPRLPPRVSRAHLRAAAAWRTARAPQPKPWHQPQRRQC